LVQGELRWGSGAVNSRIGAFTPVSSIAQGPVFSAALPGMMNARLSYTARPHGSFSFSFGGVMFWRTDLETFKDAGLDAASGDRFLGTEASGSLWLNLNHGPTQTNTDRMVFKAKVCVGPSPSEVIILKKGD
jgi:hypothetical protein